MYEQRAQDNLSTTSELRRKGTGGKKKRGELAGLDLASGPGGGKENGNGKAASASASTSGQGASASGQGQGQRAVAVPSSTGAGGSVFMRTISNPEAVLRRRRQQKLGEKLQRIDQMEKLTADGPQAATMGMRLWLPSILPHLPHMFRLLFLCIRVIS